MLVEQRTQTRKVIVIILSVVFFLHVIYLTSTTVNITITYSRCTNRGISHTFCNLTCGRFPLLADLNVSDVNWQVTNTSNGTFYLFNAYFDGREGLGNVSVVRILALINKIDPTVKTHCQLWYEDVREAVISEVREYRMLWPKYWGVNEKGASPYLISCSNPLHPRGLNPQFVSLVEEKCAKANNVMEIRNKRPPNNRKRRFLVSVKGVNFDADVSLLLIEWCEILKILGVDRVEVFVVKAHPNVVRVLEHYQAEDFVALKFLKYPLELPNEITQSWHQWSQNDLIAYHDSFYENLYLFEYMVPMDIDEFIMPLQEGDRTWTGLLERTLDEAMMYLVDFDAFIVMNRYFLLRNVHENETFEGAPKSLRFLSNVYRAEKFSPRLGNAKTFMRMDRVLAVHNHLPQSCIGANENCNLYLVDGFDAQVAHYRINCTNPECVDSKTSPVKDATLWKFKNEILRSVNATIKKLNESKGIEIKI